MTETLRALVLGTGFAGQGHALALRDASVEIMGMAGRTAHVVEQITAELGIPYGSLDWRAALTELQPDIVAVGTPGGAHFEPVMAALDQGCHIFCDKPLAATAAQAQAMVEKSVAAGVKTMYLASYRYQPYALLAKEMIAEGVIGEPLEVECASHFNLDPLIPFGWSHRLDAGGGRLNNNFTHKLAIVLNVLGGEIVSISGEVRNDMPVAPVVSGVHDFRTRHQLAPSSADEPGLEWREADAEWSYTVLAHIDAAQETVQPVSALFRHAALQPAFDDNFMAFYGSEGAIHIKGHYAQGPLYLHNGEDGWQEVPLPARIAASLPDIEDDTQRNWTHSAHEFVADIRGEGYSGYQTFYEGWIYQQIIEAIRAGEQWRALPAGH